MDKGLLSDTICAIATAAGAAGVGIIRISGEDSLLHLSKVFTPIRGGKYCPSRLYYGTVNVGGVRDKAMAVYFRAPNSFTGEDVAEIHCHGSPVLMQQILKELTDSGARIADAGEFTRRAFINGKLDLSECEGLIDIINAETAAELKVAAALHGGVLSGIVKQMQDDVSEMLAHIEVTIDYSEEGIEGLTVQQTESRLKALYSRLSALKDSFAGGRLIKEGINVAICGKPNAGKSSLLNALLGYERAIVTDIAGTTRDSIDAEYVYNGIKFRLTDTAGLRSSAETVEALGIERALAAVAAADAVLYVTERAEAPYHCAQSGHTAESIGEAEYCQIKELSAGKPIIVAITKSDLRADIAAQAEKQGVALGDRNKDKSALADGEVIELSSVTGENIQNLKKLLHDRLAPEVHRGGEMLTNRRHYDAVSRAADECLAALECVKEAYLDMTAYSLKQIYLILGEITGENSVENVIDLIFSRFCVGK